MNLSSIREGELKDVFDALETAFSVTGTVETSVQLLQNVWLSPDD